MSEPSFDRILEDFSVFRKAYPAVFSIQDDLNRLRDEYVSKSYHKQQLKRLEKMKDNQNKTLQERFNKLAEENKEYKSKIDEIKKERELLSGISETYEKLEQENFNIRNEIVLIRKRKELMECELNERISSLKDQLETFRDGLDFEIEDNEKRETKLRNEKNALQNELDEGKKTYDKLKDEFACLKQKNQSLHNNFTEGQAKIKDIQSKNDELEVLLKTNKETIDNLKEELKILEHKNDGLEHAKKALEHDKKGLELTLKQKKRQFESLSKESPEIASKICKQQGYAITSGSQSRPVIKMEPGEFNMDIKNSSKNFMCRDCYSDWLSKIPKSGDLTLVPKPLDQIKTFSSQTDLEDHILVDHIIGRKNILKCWQEGSTYICTEPDSKNGTCGFKSNSQHQYNMHVKVDHAQIRSFNIYEIYGLKSYLYHLKSFRNTLPTK